MKDLDYENVHSVNPLLFITDNANGYIEETMINKYLSFLHFIINNADGYIE